jgi:outer membrane protein assembly factor BamA
VVSRRWLVALAAASACGGQVRPPVAAPEHLGAIRIAGNRAIASDALEPALALHEAIGYGTVVDPYLLALDTERIRAAYLRRGFFAARVTAEVRREAGGQIVVFTVVEGRRAVARVEITGLPPDVPAAEARARVALGDGAPFDYDAYDAAKQPLAARVENAGYAHAEVRGTVDADPVAAVATVRYEIVPGVRCAFGEIRLTGNFRPELAAAVRARLRFAMGDRYSAQALADSQAEIYDLGRFSVVQVVPDRRGDGPTIDVAVDLAEASRHELHAGFGLGYEPITYEVRGRGGGSLVPAAQPLITLAVETRVAVTVPHTGDTAKLEPKLRILGSLQRIDLGRPRLRGEIEGGLDYQTVEAYTWAGGHIRVGLGSPLGPRWLQARIGWLLEELTFRDLVGALGGDMPGEMQAREALGLGGTQRLGAFQASIVADLRDDPIEPHRGGYLAVTTAAGTPFAGGSLRYLQVTPELRGYFSLGGVVVAARARAGQIFGDVPVTERYFSGGTSGQRGFSERQLAPIAATGETGCADAIPAPPGSLPVIGGAGLIETGVELRRQIGSLGSVPVGANLFLDGADVTCKASGLDPWRLHWAVGAGVWGKLGALKIRSDIGYPLNHEDRNGMGTFGDFAWHLGIGETY